MRAPRIGGVKLGALLVLAASTATLAGCSASAELPARPFEAITPRPSAGVFSAPPASPPTSPAVELLAPHAIALAETRPEPESACNAQPPQEWLKRASYIVDPGLSPEEKASRRKLHHDAIAYRTRHYGRVEGFGDPSLNRLEPKHYAKDGTFFGIPVRMNNRVLSALACVEVALQRECTATPYTPRVLDGLRTANTFHNDEVSNHLYGIAIDIDFDTNPCCGCVARISDRPLCKKPVASPFERTALPRCWVDTFERFGFAWLGYDRLEDTMHFEFLGDPDRIPKKKS